jgi:hypothetical protein
MQKELIQLDLSVKSYSQSNGPGQSKLKIRKTKQNGQLGRPSSTVPTQPTARTPSFKNRRSRGGRRGGGGPAELAVVLVGGKGWRGSRWKELGEAVLHVPDSSPEVNGGGRRQRLWRRWVRGSGELGEIGED